MSDFLIFKVFLTYTDIIIDYFLKIKCFFEIFLKYLETFSKKGKRGKWTLSNLSK